MNQRPEPLRFYQAFRAAFLVLMAGQVFTDLLPKVATGLILLVAAAVDKGVTEFYTRPRVTPLIAPQNASGTPLVPMVPTMPYQTPVKKTPVRKAAKKA